MARPDGVLGIIRFVSYFHGPGREHFVYAFCDAVAGAVSCFRRNHY